MVAHHHVLVGAVSRSLVGRGSQLAAVEVGHRVRRGGHRATVHSLLLPLHRSAPTEHFGLRRGAQLLALPTRIRAGRLLRELASPLLDEHLRLPIHLLQCFCLDSTRVIILICTILHQDNLFALAASGCLRPLWHLDRPSAVVAHPQHIIITRATLGQ